MEATLDWPVVTPSFRPSFHCPNPTRILRRAGSLFVAIGISGCSEPPAPMVSASRFDPQAMVAPERIAAASTTRPHATVAPTAARAERPSGLTLLGTTVGTRGAFAVVRRDGSPQSFQLRVGDTVDGRVVTAVEFDRIVLASDSSRADNTAAIVHLDITAAAPSPAEATQAPPAGPATPTPIYIEPETVVAGH